MELEDLTKGAAMVIREVQEMIGGSIETLSVAVNSVGEIVSGCLTRLPRHELALADEERAGPPGETHESLSSSVEELYQRSSELYARVSHRPAQEHESCTAQLTEWLRQQSVERDELERMIAVFSERAERNNRGSELSGSAGSSLCSEGFKYGWILSALERRLGELEG